MIHQLKQKKYISLVLCLVMLPLLVARAADSELAETASAMLSWHTADGLPSDSVTAIIQTRDGFLWIGTSAGLVRFDGVKFTKVSLTNSATGSPIGITALWHRLEQLGLSYKKNDSRRRARSAGC